MLNKNRQPDSFFAIIRGTTVKAAIVTIIAALLMPMAQAAGDKNIGGKLVSALPSPSQMLAERTVDGSSFLQDMADAVASMKGYSFTYNTTVYKNGGKTVNQEGNFYFKQPRLIRVEMTGSYKRGAVAVLGKDGKVRGHLGGALSAFTMTLSPDSDMLVGANGYPLIDSDFGGMVNVMKRFQQQGCKVRVTDNPVSVEGQTSKVYVLEFYQGSQLYKRAYIDPKSLLPLEWFDYQNGQLFARTVWKNVKMDQNIADAMFQL
jgi:outer membrane lipoprotein-sorting protein